MASFRKRGSGRWQVQLRKKGYPTQTKSFSTRAAAAQWVRSIEYEMDHGFFISRNDAYSTPFRPLIPRHSGRPFQAKPATLRAYDAGRHKVTLDPFIDRKEKFSASNEVVHATD